MTTQIAPKRSPFEGHRDLLSFMPVELVRALGQVCAEIRGKQPFGRVLGQFSYEYGKRSLERFESGDTQPRKLADVVEAYSLAFSVPLAEILRRTAELLEAESRGLLPATTQAVEQATNGHEAKRPSRRKRGAA